MSIEHTHLVETNLGLVKAGCDGHCTGYCDRPTTNDESAGLRGECPNCGEHFDGNDSEQEKYA